MIFPTKKQVMFAKQISELLQIPLPSEQSFEAFDRFISMNIDVFLKTKNKIIGDRIRNELHILDFVRDAGFTPVKIGAQGLYTTKEHDSLRIDPARNCYWFNSNGDSDSIIGFVAKYIFHGDVSAAFRHLEGFLDDSKNIQASSVSSKFEPNTRPETPVLKLPPKDTSMTRVFAYLTKSRCINSRIVQWFVDHKLLYQDRNYNCVFVSYDHNRPVFISFRGTNTYKRFLGDLSGSDYSKGFFIDNHSDQLIVTESVIDSMSVMTILNDSGIDFTKYSYLPLSGSLKTDPVTFQVSSHRFQHVYLAFDNDTAGKIVTEKVLQLLSEFDVFVSIHFPERKDWNEELVNSVKSGNKIDFFKVKGN